MHLPKLLPSWKPVGVTKTREKIKTSVYVFALKERVLSREMFPRLPLPFTRGGGRRQNEDDTQSWYFRGDSSPGWGSFRTLHLYVSDLPSRLRGKGVL